MCFAQISASYNFCNKIIKYYFRWNIKYQCVIINWLSFLICASLCFVLFCFFVWDLFSNHDLLVSVIVLPMSDFRRTTWVTSSMQFLYSDKYLILLFQMLDAWLASIQRVNIHLWTEPMLIVFRIYISTNLLF